MKKKHIPLIATFSLVGTLQAQDRPNILWLTFEDTSPHFIGCYGNKVAKTPAIDALANSEGGVRFNYAYSNSSVSSPSRSCIITGMDVNVIGTGNHRYNRDIPSDVKGFPRYLRDAGYYTTNNVKTDYNIKNANFIRDTWSESSATAHWRKRPNASTPFFSVFNINYSHQSYTTQGTFKYYLDEVFKKMNDDRKSADAEVTIPPFYRDDDEMRELIGRLQNCINYTDQIVEDHLNELNADGLDGNTIVFVFADHGQGMPRGKTCALGLGYRVPFIVWFPDKWKHLNPFGDKIINNSQICFEDLAPTILKLAGINAPSHLKGKPFLGENISESRKYIYASRNRIGESPGIERSVIKGKYVYTRVFVPYLPFVKNQGYDYNCDVLRHVRKNTFWGNLNAIQLEPFQPRQIEYLYDLENDPWEIDNLANNTAYDDLLLELRTEMVRYATEIKDLGFIPEYEMQRRSAEKIPYEIRSDYNFEKIISTALLVGNDLSVIPSQISLLTDSDPIVRYWAALGIYNHGTNAVSHKTTIENILSTETFDGVRLELAAFLYNYCDVESAAEILKSYASGADELLATSAIMKFQHFGDKILNFKDFIGEVKTHWNANDQNYCASPAANVAQILINEKLVSPVSDVPIGGESYQIRNSVTGGYLAVNSASINAKTVQRLTPNENSLWLLREHEDEFYLEKNNGQYALEISGGVVANNTSAQVKESNNTETQKWILKPYQYGYKIINKETGKGLQVNSQSKQDGAVISQWDWTGSPHFVWKLEKQTTTNLDESQVGGSITKLLNVYPNPIAKGCSLNISFILHEATEYVIQLYNIKGQLMYEKQYSHQIPGEYTVSIPISVEVALGTYFLFLQTPFSANNENCFTKILVTK